MEITVKSVMIKLNEWRKVDLYHDVIFTIGERQFPTHKVILAAAVDYFDVMFRSNFREKRLDRIELKDVNPDGFELLLAYIYTGKIELDDEILGQILPVAQYYQVKCLLKKLVDHMKRNINVNNAFYYYTLADSVGHVFLKFHVKEYAQKNFTLASKSTAFFEVTYSTLLDFINCPDTVVKDEMVKFEAIINWLQYNLSERTKHFQDLIKQICFGCISNDRIVGTVLSNELILSSLDNVKMVIGHKNEHHSGETADSNDRTGNTLRIFNMKRGSLVALDVVGRTIKKVHWMDKHIDCTEFEVVSAQNTLYLCRFKDNHNKLYYYNYRWFPSNDLYGITNAVKSMLYIDSYEGIYISSSNSLHCYDLGKKVVYNIHHLGTHVNCFMLDVPVEFQGSLVSRENVIYTCGLKNNKTSIQQYDPRVDKVESKFDMLKKLSDPVNAVLNDKMYILDGGLIQMYDFAANKCATIREYSDKSGFQWSSLHAYQGVLYAFSRKQNVIHICDPNDLLKHCWIGEITLNKYCDT